MDRNHELNAPDNDSLRTIEQVNDHSELAGLYPNAHHEWENNTLLSQEAREEKRLKEKINISLSLRKWFAIIGILVPLPFILGTLLFTLIVTYVKNENLAYLLLPAVIAFGTWMYVSFRSLKRVHAIFYEHSLRSAPFVATLLAFLVFSSQALYITMLALYSDSLIYNTLATSVVILATSIAYSGILVFIWTTHKLSGGFKIGLIGIFAGIITLVTLLVNIL